MTLLKIRWVLVLREQIETNFKYMNEASLYFPWDCKLNLVEGVSF